MSNQCRSCEQFILWVWTPTGRRMPVDPEPVENGNLIIEYPPNRGPQVRYVDPGLGTHVSHFVTCPDADDHRTGTAPALFDGELM